MKFADTIKTIEIFKEFSYKEKGSEFNAQVFSVNSVEDASEILQKIKRKYYDASHHCYAYKLVDGTIKYSDDGEPNGTAGIRILNAIDHFHLTDQLIVVIRYFGGKKLGVGALGKAYYISAKNLIENCIISQKHLFKNVIIKTDYEYNSYVHQLINNSNSIIFKSIFENGVKFECLIPPKKIDHIRSSLIEFTKGKASVTEEDIYTYR